MKGFIVKYLVVLALISFGFLGGVLFTQKDHVSDSVLEECTQEYKKVALEVNECKQNFVQLFYAYIELKEKGVKK